MKNLDTPRLLLRPYTLADAPFTHELMNSAGWLRFIGDRGIRTVADAEEYLRSKILQSWEDHGLGMFAVVLKSTGQAIGSCGLVKRDTLPAADLGFAFLPGFEGQGYGHEAATAVLEFAQAKRNLPRLLAITLPENVASVRLLKKLGFSFAKNIQFEGAGEELRLYDLNF